ncbi:hypothetical protein ACT17_15450 [Mycolicibacterium conceptionense]|uniref:Uncharacterized protein n=1 Tax=Mycolicibacterium conceptionense TaxID=451644 RepID=A0A0J8U9J4_9MYCO|nr:hypothetical protein [Mycolicibacterium conceptionense]KMV17662.1 hypothetical protein ACT17_15450 [Mycolicibacterium conceptionense]
MSDTETYIDNNDPAAIIAAGLNRLQELRGFYDQAVAELEAGRAEGRERVAALQAEVDAETSKLNDVVIDAATEFNDESSRLIDTGWASPKVLKDRGLGAIRVPAKK